MNHSPLGTYPRGASLLISLCIDGFVKFKNAEGLQPRTVDSYVGHLQSLFRMGHQ